MCDNPSDRLKQCVCGSCSVERSAEELTQYILKFHSPIHGSRGFARWFGFVPSRRLLAFDNSRS